MIFEILVDKLLPALVGAAPFVYKHYLDNRNRKKESRVMLDSIRETNQMTSKLKDEFSEFKADHAFRGQLKDFLRTKATSYVYQAGLSKSNEQVLMFISSSLENIGLNYYYTKLRENSLELKNHLSVEFSNLLTELKDLLTSKEDPKVVEKFGKEQSYYFSKWVEKSELYQRLAILETRLGDNGFKTWDEFEKMFKENSLRIFDEFVKSVASWRQLHE